LAVPYPTRLESPLPSISHIDGDTRERENDDHEARKRHGHREPSPTAAPTWENSIVGSAMIEAAAIAVK